MQRITSGSIHDASFSAFGRVLTDHGTRPTVEEAEISYWAGIAGFDLPARLSSGYLISRHTSELVDRMERHLETPEMLVALESDAVICMAPPTTEVTRPDARFGAFTIRRGEAILMHPGTWHWLPIPVASATAEFLVVFRQGTEEEDMEVRELAEPIAVEV